MTAAQLQRRLRISGIVQGVGFRPYVWHLANELKLAGWVRNDAAGVEVLVEGAPAAIDAFTQRLPQEIPPLAQVRDLSWSDAPASGAHAGFAIAESGAGQAATLIGPDTAVCPDCLAELFDPADRRWRYPFINCTHCGPRYTLTRRLPYDRAQTSMAAFPLCPDCEREYRDPANRRFHAEPTACPACGPGVWLELLPSPAGGRGEGGEGDRDTLVRLAEPLTPALTRLREREDALTVTLRRLQAGQIVALKGLGGFHLACDARNAAAVQTLRERKNREEKPFAVMAANAASLAEWVEMSGAERQLLESPEHPIVLLRKKPAADAALPGIAPGLAWLGALLPYTPLHWLLFHAAAGQPAGTDWLHQPQALMLVMTSANPGGEPLVIGNDEARERLAGIADAILMHDRDIVARTDDSVVRGDRLQVTGDKDSPVTRHPSPVTEFQFIRRARGYTPRAIRLPLSGPTVLALGGWLKNTICVTRGDEAYLSQHIGSLDNPATCEMLVEVAHHLLDILEVRPQAVAHDLHPDFFSTRHARELAEAWGVPAVAVQHHHAHIAAVAAEHGVTQPILGLALDGVGLGSDGGAWGGELLRLDGADFTRLGHLAPLPLPGGDRAAKAPWRMAAAALFLMGRGDEIARRFAAQAAARQLLQLLQAGQIPPVGRPSGRLEQGVGLKADPHRLAPPTTSLGRWFDAAAGLLGIRAVMAYEGQAAMLLEGLAEQAGAVDAWRDGYRITETVIPALRQAQGKPGFARAGIQPNPAWTPACAGVTTQLDLLPLLARLADEQDARHGAALFHATLAQALADWTERAARQQGLTTVALGGGCFLNHILSRQLGRLLAERGLTVLEARQVPPNDGGLSLGQAWVAMQTLNEVPAKCA